MGVLTAFALQDQALFLNNLLLMNGVYYTVIRHMKSDQKRSEYPAL